MKTKRYLHQDIICLIEIWGGYRSLHKDIKRSLRKFKLAKVFKKHNKKTVAQQINWENKCKTRRQ